MATKQFKKEDLQDLLWGCEVEGMEQIGTNYSGSSRWSKHYELIFKAGVVFYGVDYRSGATEMQDEHPFEDEGEYVECYEVRPVEKTVVVYEKVID